MKFKKRTLAATLAASATLGVTAPAWADGGGVAAGLMGGMILGRAISNNRAQERAYAYDSGYNAGGYRSQPQTVVVQQPAPAASGASSAEQRMGELNDMHKKGLISDSEYQAKRKSILDSM